jgi:hypothetical protein
MAKNEYYTGAELEKLFKQSGFKTSELKRYTKSELSTLLRVTKKRIKEDLREIDR